MRTLANEFGISDVGLAKLCRRHQIPLPGRGYWARLQFGQKPQRIALAETMDSRLESVTIVPPAPKQKTTLTPEEAEQIPTIDVAVDGPVNHVFARRIQRNITRANFDERGMLLAKSGAVVPIKASPTGLARALRIADALFPAMDRAGYKVDWPAPYNTGMKTIVLGEKLAFFISEATNRREHQPTSEERARQKKDTWWRPPQWDITPSGRLRFTLSSSEYSNVSQAWSDGKRRKLESCVGEIFCAYEKTANAIKQERADRAEAERRRIEEQKRQAEVATRNAEYDRKAEALKKLADAWEESKLVKDFTLALQANLVGVELAADLKEELEKMVEWGHRHANYLDPLTDLKWVAQQFKNPPWLFGY
jgi:hypothetical protein